MVNFQACHASLCAKDGHLDEEDTWTVQEREALIRFLVAWPDWKKYFTTDEIARYIHDDLEDPVMSIRPHHEVETYLRTISRNKPAFRWTRFELDTLESICELHPLLSDTEVAAVFRQMTGAHASTDATLENGRSVRQCVEAVENLRANRVERYAELSDEQVKHEQSLVDTLQPSLCDFCRKLDFGLGHEPLSEAGEESGRIHHVDEFHSTVADLNGCASKCPCCRFISQCVKDKLRLVDDAADGMGDWKLYTIDTGHRPSLSYQYKWGAKEQTVILSFHTAHVADWGLPLDRSSPSTMKHLTIASGRSSQLAPQIKAWMRTCQKYHRACRLSPTCTMPDRVLDVGSTPSTRIKLIRSSGLRHPYAALSYCWGDTEQYRLTSETTDLLATGVAYSDLAQTTRDAIDIVRQIGLCYIWIDALCIYQDDRADWERQSANMGNIYENALLTLVASNASSTAEGFLRDRPPSEAYCGYTSYQGSRKAVYLCQPSVGFEVATFYERSDMVAHEPLSTRGWAQQERLLSTRTVMFGARQMFWQCRESTCTENGLMPDDDSLGLAAVVDLKQPHATWISAVENFSGSKLTRMSDRLPALSGLASTYAKLAGDKYLAGHWYNEMVKDSLLWRAQSRQSRQRGSEYRAPSWSWASVDGPVLYPQQERTQRLGTYFSTLGVKKTPLATIHDYSITVKGANPFGEVTNGRLDLHAPVIPLRAGALSTLLRLPRIQSYATDAHLVHLRPRGESIDGSLESIFDHVWTRSIREVEVSIDDPYAFTDLAGHFVAIAEESSTYFKGDNKTVTGIVVTPTSPGDKTFRRFGVFFDLYGIPLPEPSIISLV